MDVVYCFSSYLGTILRICGLMVAIPILRYVSMFVAVEFSKRFSRHIGVLIGHVIFYGGIAFVGVNILHEFGFNVTALLGAAGVVGVAIGFASQTSISNIISGFFLLVERPFSVGDTIKSGDIIGIAESIDLLAVRVRTLDNKLVRIPNEMVLKHSLTNLTYYSIKRIDLLVSVTYGEKIDVIMRMIRNVVKREASFLKTPEPIILMNKVAQQEFSAEMRNFLSVRVWVAKDQFSIATSLLIEQLKNEFDEHGIAVTIVALN